MSKLSAKTALIIDANALLHRAWHALPPMTSPDGVVVNAVYGFTSTLLKILEQEHPAYLAVCWDTPEPTYRHEARTEYKSQREAQPDEFYAQAPLVKDVVEALGGINVEKPGFEADDILATFAKIFSKKKIRTLLLTNDRDVFQAIDAHAHVVAFKKGVTDTVVYDEKMLLETTGLTPKQIPDYKAMRGDPSDNLKGIPGVGDKTATELLQTYGNLTHILKAAHDEKSKMKPAIRKRLLDGEDEARSLLPIVTLDAAVTLPKKMQSVERQPVDEKVLKELFLRFGFRSLHARLFGRNEVTTAKKEMTKTQKPTGSASQRYSNPSEKEIVHFFDEVNAEKALIMHPLTTPQDSLFQDAPILALGSATKTILLREKDVVSKRSSLFAEIVRNESIRKIGHNLKTSWHWAADRGFELRGISFDVEIASYLLAGGEGRHDLASAAASHLERFFSDSNERPLEEVEAIRALAELFRTRLQTEGLDRVNERFEIPLISILGGMEREGILIDLPYFKKLTTVFRKAKARLEQEMEQLAGEPFNPGSPSQLAHIFFDVLELPTSGIKRGKTGISTAASELVKLEGQHPIIEKVSEYREVAKLLSTYVEAMPVLADSEGRVHTTYNQALAATGRLSSSAPNIQNIPIRTELGREIRHGFIAKKGYVLLSCDYSQIELRVVAALAKDKAMIAAFQGGRDIHTATAAAVWGIDEAKVTATQRRAAKAVNFGIVYGQGPHGLAKSAGISFGEAQEFIENYFLVYSGVYEYLQTTKALARDRGYVETLFGRKRTMRDILSPNRQARAAAERMAINMPVQGTAADIMKLAMIEVEKKLGNLSRDSRMLLQVHDELVFEVPEKEPKKIAPHIQEIMANVESIGVPLVVDAKVGTNWDKMESL